VAAKRGGGSLALIITKLGRSTVKVDDGDATNGADAASSASSSMQAVSLQPASKAATPCRGSKLGEVIALLSRTKGAGVEDWISATGCLSQGLSYVDASVWQECC
jgi:hypothetical protein